MDVRDPTWKHRYDGLGFRIDPAIESFCLGELALFDRSLEPVKPFPKLEKFVQDFRARVADPLIGVLVFRETAIPLTEEHARHAAELYDSMQTKAAARSAELSHEACHMLARQKQQADLWSAFDAEIKQKHKVYEYFVTKELSQEILRRHQSSSIITLDDSAPLMRAVTVRNEIYRTALRSKDRAWLVGWDLAIVAKHQCAISEQITYQLQMYGELKDDAEYLIPKDKRIGIALAPILGPLDTSVENMYEKLLPRQLAIEESAALNRAVTDHIARRVAEIYT